MAQELTLGGKTYRLVIDPQDRSRRAEFRKQHLILDPDGRTLLTAGDRAEALTWLDGFSAGFARAMKS